MNKKAQIFTLFFMVLASRHYRFPADILLIHLTTQLAQLNNAGRLFGEILT